MASVVQVTDELGVRLDGLVAAGRFETREAAVEAAVGLVPQDDAWFRMVERKIANGRTQIEAGQGIELDAAFDELFVRLSRP